MLALIIAAPLISHPVVWATSVLEWLTLFGLISIFGGVVAWYTKHECHEHGCLRPSWHPDESGHPVCKKHHPDHPSRGFWWDFKNFLRTGHWGDENHPRHSAAKAAAREAEPSSSEPPQ